MRTFWAAILAVGLSACDDGRSVVEVTIDSTGRLTAIDSLRVVVTNAGQTAPPVIFNPPDGPLDIPPARTFELGFSPDRSGPVTIAVDAMSHGQTMASGKGAGTIEPGHFTKMTLILPGSPGADMGSDAAPYDMTTTCTTDDDCGPSSYCAGHTCLPKLFGATISVSLPSSPRIGSIVAADFNLDSKQDLAAALVDDSALTILLGDGKGSFKASTTIPTDHGPGPITVDDFNGDHNLDLAAGCFFSDSSVVDVFLGDGTGKLKTEPNISAPWNRGGLSSGKFLGSGLIDLIVGEDDGLFIFAGVGDGSFGKPIKTMTDHANILAVADFDGDGRLDVATNNYFKIDNSICIQRGQMTGLFTDYATVSVAGQVFQVVATDVNGDTRADLIARHFNPDGISVALNNGNGTFGKPTSYLGITTEAIVVADFNGDGYPDIAAAYANQVTILLGDKNGVYSFRHDYPTKASPYQVIAADFNGDGKMDIAIANPSDVSILLNVGP